MSRFTPDLLAASQKARALGIDNTPPAALLGNGRILAAGLERVELILGHPLVHSSGYRCPALNAACPGASPTSDHMQFLAEDFTCPAFGTPLEVVKALEASDLEFDQIIQEGTWVHAGFGPRMRREVLTKHEIAGVISYTKGA